MSFAVGSLVRAREREWVVLPESNNKILMLRPLGGTEEETTGIYLPLEKVEPAIFALPNIEKIGDYRSSSLLRDAVRLGFRSSAGPFRSFAKISVEARPYQLVPLLLALKLDPIRLLIADDVGIGKTVEACLIARELIDRGEIKRLAVLCPPHLAEQWQAELKEKFHIDAELVLANTARRLERHCVVGQSIFDVYPYLVVSIDFIKSDRRRDDFLRTCPEFVIVDEAHTCAFDAASRSGRHQRHQLVKGLAENENRHLVLVTATPHSGKEEAFRSLLTLLNPNFATLPEDLSGKENEKYRRHLAQHFVQRRRADLRHYLKQDTPFPERLESEQTYKLSPEYKKLFDKVVRYAREIVHDPEIGKNRQRIRWWSALALLRSLASSPAAAIAALNTRAANAEAEELQATDEIGRRTILDLEDHDATEAIDIVPGCNTEGQENEKRRLRQFAKEAEELLDKDNKLKKATDVVKSLLEEDWQPILFCRFIPTAEYLATQLRKKLSKNVEIIAVTGLLPPAEREKRIAQLAQSTKRVLVCTDCLSEGINLQENFDTIIHYDLAWNPTRHEQREGRVDRFGQPKADVHIITYYGIDNKIDGIVLDVLLRKHKKIRSSLGISIPLPVDSNQVIEAVFEGILLKEEPSSSGEQLRFEFFSPDKEKLHWQWENVAEKEKRSRTMFAQETIKVEDVAQEFAAVRDAIGSGIDVANFVQGAVQICGGVVSEVEDGTYDFEMSESPLALREAIGNSTNFTARFELPTSDQQLYLSRTHPIVEGLASFLVDTALDPITTSKACRAGVIRTNQVQILTTLLLLRLRYHIVVKRDGEPQRLLAEDSQIRAFTGSPKNAQWLDREASESLLGVVPDKNVTPQEAKYHLKRTIENFAALANNLEQIAYQRGEELLDAHRRVRAASRTKGVSYDIEPKLPPDVLGIYLYLPASVGV